MEFKFSDYVPSIDQIFQIILFNVRAVYTFEHVHYISYMLSNFKFFYINLSSLIGNSLDAKFNFAGIGSICQL